VSSSDRLRNAAALLDKDFPEAWIPQVEGDELVGVFARLEHGQTVRGPAWIVILTTEDGVERAVWLVHTALRNELQRQAPRPGEAVAIRYLGMKRTADDQNDFVAYRVAVDRDATSTDWSQVGQTGASVTPPATVAVASPLTALPAAPATPAPAAAPGPVPAVGDFNRTAARCDRCMALPGEQHADGCFPY
jgi:hypothetical protein